MDTRLKKLRSKHGEYIKDSKESVYVYHANNPHIFMQACGYLKHIHGKEKRTSVYYRGQSSLYGCSLVPSLFRGMKHQVAATKRNSAMNKYINACRENLKHVPEYAWEPLLQHYGIKTRWIDVVDNVWIALWFACHNCYATGPMKQYLHFEKRAVNTNGKDNFAYILLVETGNNSASNAPGLFEDDITQAIDLRIACPSTFIRPHAQHGLLVKKKTFEGGVELDYSDVIAGVIRVSLRDAFAWLGDGSLLTPHVLFPSPVYDIGYRDLLEYAPSPDQLLGAIHHIGA